MADRTEAQRTRRRPPRTGCCGTRLDDCLNGWIGPHSNAECRACASECERRRGPCRERWPTGTSSDISCSFDCDARYRACVDRSNSRVSISRCSECRDECRSTGYWDYGKCPRPGSRTRTYRFEGHDELEEALAEEALDSLVADIIDRL